MFPTSMIHLDDSSMELLSSLYLFGIFAVTVLAYLLNLKLAIHGRTASGINKFYYFILYLTAVILLRHSSSAFIIHPMRRFVETLVYSRQSKSQMTYLHFLHGLVYFIVLSSYLHDRQIEMLGFVLVNLFQAIAHYRVYWLKFFEYSHYYSEILVYGYIFYCLRTWAMFWNLMYIIAFVVTSRTIRQKQPREVE